jgi:hypothetical protein
MLPLFVRTHQSFQAAVILAESGMIGDAHTVLRSAVEGAIALHALADNPDFVDRLIAAHHINQQKLARIALGNAAYRATYSQEQIAQMEALVAEVDAMRAESKEQVSDIVWADVARRHCPDLYDLLYRLLSWDGTHTNVNSINRHVITDANMQITGLKMGPDTNGLVETLSASCLTFLWAAGPFARAFGRDDISVRISSQLRRFNELPQDNPNTPALSLSTSAPKHEPPSE